MWKSNILIIVDRKNADSNTVVEIADAVIDCGGNLVEINEDRYLIEATVSSHVVATVSAMEGVAYVRVVFNYFCGSDLQAA